MCSHDDRYPTHILFRCKGGWGIERKCYRLSAPKINTRLTSILCAGITHHFRPPHPPPRTNDRISKILNRKLATPLDPKPRLLPISLRNSRSKERAQLCSFSRTVTSRLHAKPLIFINKLFSFFCCCSGKRHDAFI